MPAPFERDRSHTGPGSVAKQVLNRTEITASDGCLFRARWKSHRKHPGADLETTGNEQEATYVCERLSRT